MAEQADVDLAPIDPLDRQPVEELGRPLPRQRAEHGAPALERLGAAPADAAAEALDALPLRRVELPRLFVEPIGQRAKQTA
jgi:hypothetical protein